MKTTLKSIQWNKDLILGIPQIDEQHKQLIQYLNDLHECQKNSESDAVLKYLLQRLEHYAETHFKDEENLMRQWNYQGQKVHEGGHRRFHQTIQEFIKRLERNEAGLDLKLIRYLNKWIKQHILIKDSEMIKGLVKAKEKNHDPSARHIQGI